MRVMSMISEELFFRLFKLVLDHSHTEYIIVTNMTLEQLGNFSCSKKTLIAGKIFVSVMKVHPVGSVNFGYLYCVIHNNM